MKTGDLITSYLSNEMNPEQERQFLLSVAASDSLRLALKSHVMLDRIVTRQTQQVNVPSALRENIFAQMSASMGTPAGGAASAIKSPGILSRFSRGAMMALLTVSGFAAGYFIHPQAASNQSASGAARQPAVRQMDGGGLPSDSPAPIQGSVTTQSPSKSAAEPSTQPETASRTASSQQIASAPVERSHSVGSVGVARASRSAVSLAPAVLSSSKPATVAPAQTSAASEPDPLNPSPTKSSVGAGDGKNGKVSTDGADGSPKADVELKVLKSDGSHQKIQGDPK
ncbi:MAG: hypothetical protein JWQ98_2506 [Chlorobi bacterium]|nr:hypothetical protein [Chlorobiota bacterium]